MPTLDLVIAHQHPEDREAAMHLIDEIRRRGGQEAIFHRLIDSKGREHRVLTVAESDRDENGNITTIHGITIDLTRSLAVESGQVAAAAVVNAYGSRAVIEQAKGMLMAHFNVGPEKAFDLLVTQSQHTNIKVAALAEALVAAANSGRIDTVLRHWATRPRTKNGTKTNDIGGGAAAYQQS